jgi:hypothetical protein
MWGVDAQLGPVPLLLHLRAVTRQNTNRSSSTDTRQEGLAQVQLQLGNPAILLAHVDLLCWCSLAEQTVLAASTSVSRERDWSESEPEANVAGRPPPHKETNSREHGGSCTGSDEEQSARGGWRVTNLTALNMMISNATEQPAVGGARQG